MHEMRPWRIPGRHDRSRSIESTLRYAAVDVCDGEVSGRAWSLLGTTLANPTTDRGEDSQAQSAGVVA